MNTDMAGEIPDRLEGSNPRMRLSRTPLLVFCLGVLAGLTGCNDDDVVVDPSPTPSDLTVTLSSPADSARTHADSIEFTWNFTGSATGETLSSTVLVSDSGTDPSTSPTARQYAAGTNTSLAVSLADFGGWREWAVSVSNTAGRVWQSSHRPLNILVQPGGPGDPDIEFTSVPAFGTTNDLRGRVLHVWTDECLVAVYLYVNGGWWTKPYWSTPLTSIDDAGEWSCDVTTGGIDQRATQYIVFLVPNSYDPPLAHGESSLPEELNRYCLARVQVARSP